MKVFCIVAALILGACQHSGQASQRLANFIAALNSKDRAKIEAMIQSEFASSMLQARTLAQWTDQTMQIAAELAPVKTTATRLDEPHTVVAEIQTSKGEKLGIRIDCSPEAPHKIIGLRIDESADNLLVKQSDYSKYTDLADLAKRVLADSKVPAIAVGVIAKDKMQVAVEGTRKAGSEERAKESDRWLVGSNAKSMTAVLMATLIEQGKIRWDSTLGELLPELPMLASYKTVTIEQLMQHMSGVQKDMTFTGQAVNKIVGDLKDPVKIRATYAKDVLNREPLSKPGEKFAYSNAGYSILGHIAERIEKKPFEQLIKERVFDKLGMKDSLVGSPGAEGMPGGPNQVHGHYPGRNGPMPGKITGPLNHMMAPAGGGVACSISDLLRYTDWHMKGFLGETVPLLKPDTIKRLHTPLARPTGMEVYSAGWLHDQDPENHRHMGSDGSFTAIMAFYPKQRVAIVTIVNMGLEAPVVNGLNAIEAREVKG